MPRSRFQPPQTMPDDPIEYSKFWQLWRGEKFFECHEELEELWRRTKTPERWFYNGLIHSAVAIYQHRRGNVYGACRQMCRAQVKLQLFAPRFRGVDIFALLESLQIELASSLSQMTAAQREELFVVRDTIQKRMARDFPIPDDAPED